MAFLRAFFSALILVPWMLHTRFSGLRGGRWRIYPIRCLVGGMGMLCGFAGFAALPLAQSTALGFAVPVIATIGAALILRETVRARRWTAVVVGFIGVLVIARPSLDTGVSPGVLWMMGFVLGAAGASLFVKYMTRSHGPIDMVAYFSLFLTIIVAPFAWWVWTPPPIEVWVMGVGLGLLGVVGHFCWYRAFALADASAMLPLDYARLPVAAVLAFFILGEVPVGLDMVGAGIIIASGVYIIRREAAVARQKALETSDG